MDGRSEENLEHVLAEENQHEIVALARALCPFAEAATDAQILMCVAFVEAKGNEVLVARELGLAVAAVRKQVQSRLSESIIKRLAKNKLSGIGYLKAVCALMDVASSESQTGNARNNASKTIIELVDSEDKKNGGDGDDGIDLNQMTLKQLEAFVGSIKRDLVKIPLMVDVTPTDK